MKKKTFLLFLSAFIFLNFSLCFAEGNEDSVSEYYKGNLRDDYYKQGEALFKKAQYEEAILKFKEALRFDPQYEPALKYLELSENKVASQDKQKEAKILGKRRKSEKLETKLGLVEAEKEFKYLFAEGKFYFNLGKLQEATVKFKNALKIDPDNVSVQRYIALIENKIARQKEIEERKKLIENEWREAQEKKRLLIEAKKERTRKIKERQEATKRAELQTQKLKASEVLAAELPASSLIYRIDKEDTLEISVWRHPELTKEVIVRPDGKISYLLVGDIQAGGLTIPELKEKITQGLSEFSQRKLKPSVSEKPEEKGGYLIGFGDTLEISIWKVPDLSRDVIVRPDGMISFPLIGDLKAEGITLVQLDEQITQSLTRFIKNPQVSVMVRSFGWKKEIPEEVMLEDKPEVSVMIKQFGGRKVIVLGDVAKPGVYTFLGDMRLAEAIALAGDFTKYGLKDNVMVIRGDIHNNPTVIYANMLALLKDARLCENVLIQPQDVIFVPRSVVGNINTFLEALAPLVDTAYKGFTADELIRRR
jgi:polysaccharide biosynthesis/export protein